MEKKVVETIQLIKASGVLESSITIYGMGSMAEQIRADYPDITISPYSSLELNHHDTVVSSAVFEGMPNAIIDALANTAKIALSQCWAHTELFLRCRSFGVTSIELFTPGDSDSFKHALEALGQSEVDQEAIEALFAEETELLYSGFNQIVESAIG